MATFSFDSDTNFGSLADMLRARANEHGSRIAFRFLADGESEESQITYEELEVRARSIAASLLRQDATGKRALLFYPAGLDFITAFWGCMYAGVVAVPVFPARLHRQLPRLLSIAADSEAKFVLTTEKIGSQTEDLFKRAPDLEKLQWQATDTVSASLAGEWRDPGANAETLALLQYTSGSTAAPRGVMVTHGNLLHNLARLQEVFQFSTASVGVTWLPHYHDMGLIGGLLQPIYAGGEMIVMPPSAFLRRPICWLVAVTRYRATTMVGPNFAYDLCERKIPADRRAPLDLSNVTVALCGAEPVRPNTLDRFAEAFGPCGFRKESFRPAYGLAEATLIVSGRSDGGEPFVRTVQADELRRNLVRPANHGAANSRILAGCGKIVPDMTVAIVDSNTLLPCGLDRVGEIWVSGPSVAKGYWRKPEETKQTFSAHMASGEGPFLRTGDLGFLDQGRLIVTGRLKDLIIIHGANHYPQDLELTVEQSHRALRPACGAAFSIDVAGAERLVVVQELSDNAAAPNEEVVVAIRRALSESHEVQPDSISLIKPRTIPRTSSGKIQRYACREAFLEGALEVIYQWRDSDDDAKENGASPQRSGLVWDYLSKQSSSHSLAGNANAHGNGKHELRSGNAMAVRDTDPIAIVGIGCRFPGAVNIEEFWSLLRNGVDAITEIPGERWNVDALYDARPGIPGKMSTRWGGFLPDIDQFDPHFFGISPREAAAMDPQQRLLLEVSWQALENAGQPPDKLAGSRTGVFIGIGGFDYSNLILNYENHLETINAYLGTGNAHSIAANRISYLLDLRGPSVAIDTACSSSLVAIHMACESLRSAQVDLAIAGAVNLILSPEVTIAFSHARMMAADGRCKTFDAKADGYVRAEGCGVVILKRLSDALRDRDHILALLRGSAVNQDGRTAGIAAPNGSAQQSVIREALAQSNVAPRELTYIEAHGTGTSVGDPIEIEAIKGALGVASPNDPPCLLGSVKANIGHLENASGMASLTKVLCCLQHGEIPGQIHFTELNPRISLSGTRVVIPSVLQHWPNALRRLAGISSFGFGGTNAHIIVEEAPAIPRPEDLPGRPSEILTLSARTESALKKLAGAFEKHLAECPEQELANICFSANAGRSHFAHRLAAVVENRDQLKSILAAYSAETPPVDPIAGLHAGHSSKKDGPRMAFLFGAEVSNASEAWQLYEIQPVFRSAIDRCSQLLDSSLKAPLLSSLSPGRSNDELRDTALFALQYALAELWRSWGIEPDAVLGAGVGEYAAAVTCGALSCKDALKLIVKRARLLRLALQGGGMDQAANQSDDLEDFNAAAEAALYESPKVPFVSGLTGQILEGGEIPDAAYWRRHFAQNPQFEEGFNTLAAKDYEFFIEMGPDGLHRDLLLHKSETASTWLCSIENDRDAWQSMLASLASLYVRGASVDWTAFNEPYQPWKVPLPTYPFERERCWEEKPNASNSRTPVKPPHPLLGERLSSALPMEQYQSKIGIDGLRYLNDHRIQNSIVFPAAAYLEMARAASSELFGAGTQVLSSVVFHEALILPASGTRTVQSVTTPASSGSASFQIYSSNSNPDSSLVKAAWTLHASGDMRREGSESDHSVAEQISLDSIRARCTTQKTGVELYESLKNMGLEYGPSFRCAERLWCGPREALGELRQPSISNSSLQAAGRPDEYWIHPALLDSCLQVLAAALPEDETGSERKWTYLPSGLTGLRFLARPASRLFSHCVVHADSNLGAEFLNADIRLLDEDGRVTCEILGFRVKLVAGEASRDARENPGDLLYDVTWIAKRLTSLQQSNSSDPSSWLILADRGSIGQSLAAHLKSQGDNCAVASPNDLREFVIPSDCTNVILLSSLDLCQLADRPHAILEAQTSWIETLEFVQALLREASGSKRRLWIVTRGAQAVGPTPATVSLAQTPLWGLAKSIDLEHPELRCTRIDLDPNSDAEELLSLIQELSLPGSEGEVAFRKGTRYVSRLVARTPQVSRGALMEIPDADSFRMDISRPGNIDNLILRATPRSAPRPGEVEIQVRAAGLNFRDVMNAAGVYPGGPIPFGAECSGTIASMGSGVTGMQVGDEVIALASGSFAAFTTTGACAVIPKPPAFSFGQAATIPIAFLTAYYSLHHLAKLSRGERVLIHAAAGGVGLAAVQLAQRAGAEVFATAGSLEKRAHLKSMRVPHVLDSRSLEFADEVLKRTGGQGVDVVLNSLPGEYITRSLSILAPHGRFVEIGKTDIYQNKPLGLFPFRNNLSYFALDLDRVCRERPELVRSLFLELMAMFNDGSLRPLPQQIFSVEDAANAFRHMARRKNIGKVVLSFRNIESKTRSDRSLAPQADASYLITGGHGGLGLAVARWLVEKGARYLVLLNRSGESSAGKKISAELSAKGATVKTIHADISDEKDMARALTGIRDSMPPLRGVIHAAGVLEDRVLLKQDAGSFKRVLAPKVMGAWNLHVLTSELPLDFFVVFSSVAAVLGSPGQGNYAAANAFLDGLAHDRRSRGLPGLSIDWGPWAEVGMAARASSSKGVASRIMRSLSPKQALAALDRLFEKQGPAQAIVMSVDWALLSKSFNGHQPPALIAELVHEKVRSIDAKLADESAGPRLCLREFLATPPALRHALLLGRVQKVLAQVMVLDAPDVDPEESLSNLGLDSLMALELQHSLEELFGMKMPIDLMIGMPSLNEFVNRLMEILTKPATSPDPELSKEILRAETERSVIFPPVVEA